MSQNPLVYPKRLIVEKCQKIEVMDLVLNDVKKLTLIYYKTFWIYQGILHHFEIQISQIFLVQQSFI